MSEPQDFASFPQPMVSEPIMKGYRDPGWISSMTIFFLVLELIIFGIAIPGNMNERTVLLNIQAEAYETGEEMTAAAEASDTIQRMIGLVGAVVIFGCSILFLMWTHRFVKNAYCISVRPLRFRPGWAVGYYFIPILNLFRPLQALSDAHRVSINPSNWVAAPGSYLLGWWWCIHLLAGFISNTSLRLTLTAMRGESIELYLAANAVDTFSYLASMPLVLLSIWVVWKLCHAQQEVHQQVVYSPPSPFVTEEIYPQPIPEDTWIIPSHTSGWAIAAGYAGLFAVLFFPAPIALILGIIAYRDCKKRSVDGRGRAIFAVIMGAIFSAILLLIPVCIMLGHVYE